MSTSRVWLLGTAAGDWRVAFVDTYREAGIAFTDPQVETLAAIEGQLAPDSVLVVAVTGATYGTDMLARMGFAVARVQGTDRHLFVHVEPNLDGKLTDQGARRESMLARDAVTAELDRLRWHNVRRANSLAAMLNMSIDHVRRLSRPA
jgi:hypothetical protein